MVKVMGVRTFETVPGRNLQRRNALNAALSRMGLPVLWAMTALVTLPLEVSTVMTQTPLPVARIRRASYGYSGRGALTATALAEDIDIVPGTPAGFGRAIGATGFGLSVRGLGGGVGFSSSTNSGFSSGNRRRLDRLRFFRRRSRFRRLGRSRLEGDLGDLFEIGHHITGGSSGLSAAMPTAMA